MQVVRILHMGMVVPGRSMAVPVAVLSDWHVVMGVQVMAIVVVNGMFMLQLVMGMGMTMRLRQMTQSTNFGHSMDFP